ncbi:MAG: hypothetical protein FJ119_12240 [Deltaproteobacteria bacterium]|nr:hypothetical protein [Deltaproteobacteria bacterium]
MNSKLAASIAAATAVLLVSLPAGALDSRVARYFTGNGPAGMEDSCRRLADTLAQSVEGRGRLRVAVAEFTEERSAGTGTFGIFMTEQFELALHETGTFRVLEQQRLKALLGRIKLEMSDLYDENTVSKLGKFQGVDALLLGSYWDHGEDGIKVIVKLIDLTTAQQISHADAIIRRDTIPQRYRPLFNGQDNVQRAGDQDRYFIEAYQIDDIARIFVNDTAVAEIDIPPGSPSTDYDSNYKRIDITTALRPGKNTIRFVAANRPLPFSWGRCGYGFKVLKNETLLWKDEKKHPRHYDPEGVFYDQKITLNLDEMQDLFESSSLYSSLR